MRGRICCSCLWFRRSPGPFCETRDPGPREMQIRTMRCWDEGVHCWTENECLQHFVPFTPSPKHLPGLCRLPPPCLMWPHSVPMTPPYPPLAAPTSRAATLWCGGRWFVLSLIIPKKFLPSAYIKRHCSTLSIYFPPLPAQVYIPTATGSNELAANPAMKLCVGDLCKPKINVGCVNKKLVNGVEEALCPPLCPLRAG